MNSVGKSMKDHTSILERRRNGQRPTATAGDEEEARSVHSGGSAGKEKDYAVRSQRQGQQELPRSSDPATRVAEAKSMSVTAVSSSLSSQEAESLIVTTAISDVLLPPPSDDEYSTDSSLSSVTVDGLKPPKHDDDEDTPLSGGSKDRRSKGPLRSFRMIRLDRVRRNNNVQVKEVDAEKYMADREMTQLQERLNALTMIPSPLYCLYYLLSGCWIGASLFEEARRGGVVLDGEHEGHLVSGFGGFANHVVGDAHGCLAPTWWHRMPALPPLPVLAVAVGIMVHAPFSFLYHWKYAHALPAGPRSTHWSRRLDQSMIHVASTFMSYATSGSWDFFVANVLFNADSVYRQFNRKVRPRRNKIRIIISIVAYTVPIVKRGDVALFCQLWAVFVVSGWLFIHYPLGGWSHSLFHIVIALAPPLMMRAACELPIAQDQLALARACLLQYQQQPIA